MEPYSLNILREKIFADFEVLTDHENFILENFRLKLITCGAYVWLVFTLMSCYIYSQVPSFFINPWKIYHKNFFLKEKSPNLENFYPQNIQAIQNLFIVCHVEFGLVLADKLHFSGSHTFQHCSNTFKLNKCAKCLSLSINS